MLIRTVGTTLCLMLLLTTLAIAGEEKPHCDAEADACLKYMIENLEGKGWIGIEMDYSDTKAPVISRVITGSPAEAGGLRAGDGLIAFEGVAYATASKEELKKVKEMIVPGREITVTVMRDGERQDLPVTATTLPPAVLAQWIGTHMLYEHRHQVAEVADTD